MDIQEVALQWMLQNSISSNVELAILSNVCRQWRHQLKKVLVAQAASNLTQKGKATPQLLLPTLLEHLLAQSIGSSDNFTSARTETFCVGWFHPQGIRQKLISLDDDDDDESNDSHNDEEPLDVRLPEESVAGRSKVAVNWTTREQLVRHDVNMGVAHRRGLVTVASEWRGYQDAVDVLKPFGFASSFLEDILKNVDLASPVELAETRRRNASVRGATLARPESYCLCRDPTNLRSRDKIPKTSGSNDGKATYQPEYKISRHRQDSQRRELERGVLPRVVYKRRRSQGSLEHVGAAVEDDYTTPCIQFLNAGRSHAVCMMTPPFACGPLAEPITIICVGVAMEDGCFLSGLYNRFELGHLYPKNLVEESTELSSICMATDERDPPSLFSDGHKSSFTSNLPEDDKVESGIRMLERTSSNMPCQCIFRGATDKMNILDDDDYDDDEADGPDSPKRKVRLTRGRMGPGAWHCYVAVFDGDHSMLRIDGVTEPLEVESRASDRPSGKTGVLDGLTIGSDHCFGSSLCSGQGSNGEGEGAISELAIFAGRLPLPDIHWLEAWLMAKHDIATKSADSMWQENDWQRQSRALFLQGEDSDVDDEEYRSTLGRVPLRFLSRQRAVAWQLVHPVTGEVERLDQIGSKGRGGAASSDW